MARIAGVELPGGKRVVVGVTSIYGVGRSRAQKILGLAKVDTEIKVKDLNDGQIDTIRKIIEKEFRVEGDLRTEVELGIKRLYDIGCYRGLRHRMGLPVRGQKTRTNSRTRKGKRRTVMGKKKPPSKK